MGVDMYTYKFYLGEEFIVSITSIKKHVEFEAKAQARRQLLELGDYESIKMLVNSTMYVIN